MQILTDECLALGTSLGMTAEFTKGMIKLYHVEREASSMQLFEAALQPADEEKFVERSGTVVKFSLKFSHDRIQQYVYDIAGSGRARDMLHYQIGKYLKKCYDEHVTLPDWKVLEEMLRRGYHGINGVPTIVEFQMYGVRCKYNEAIARVCRVLRLLGETMPIFFLFKQKFIDASYD
jgi:hypothetical protein